MTQAEYEDMYPSLPLAAAELDRPDSIAPNPEPAAAARPRCPYCKAEMVRAKIEMDSFWLVCWLCECKAED